ncbi:head GIN domain-containing protein [Flavobacterium sp.]|uniref:head GIN domain-containing protein n=1 Tax=Flavobacterium sp. TaxID=239 RepID=UPI0035283D91
MKKLFINGLTFLMFSIANAQVEKNLGDFHKVTSFDQIDVTLVKALENKIELKGNGANEVEIINKNGELKIRMPFSKMMQGDAISATLYYKNIEAVEANEGSHISSNDVFTTSHFDIIVKEGAQVKLILETEKLSVRISNGSILELTGKADFTDVLINSGAEYEASDLLTKQTTVTANAGGKAEIFATDYVNAKVRAGGEIDIYGKPKQIDQKTIAGGSIKQVAK